MNLNQRVKDCYLLNMKRSLLASLAFTLIGCTVIEQSNHAIGTTDKSVLNVESINPTFNKPDVTDTQLHTNSKNNDLLSQSPNLDNQNATATDVSDYETDTSIYGYAATLNMQTVFPVVHGRYVIENGCLLFERQDYDETSLLTPFFHPSSSVFITPNKDKIMLDNHVIKLGEMIMTGGSVKEDYYNYVLINISTSSLIESPEHNPCFLDKAIFMNGKAL